MSLFDGGQPFKIDKPIRLIELFAGIGSQAKALKNIGANFEHYRICEFDKYAVQSYNAVYGTDFKTSDITKITAGDLGIIDTDKYCYVMTYSFPCQDLSNAGLGKGMAKGSGTRSGLLWEVERLLDECNELPQVLVMENVPAVIGAKNIQHFAKWQEKLESLGYKNKWQILNAKDFGIPQNRERCFMVSLLGDYYYEFPKTIPLQLRLKDMLEKEVDEKYYLSSRALNGMLNSTFNCSTLDARTEKDGVKPTLCARDYKDPKLVIEDKGLKQELCDELIVNGMVEEGDVIRHSYTNDRLNNGVKNMGRTESKDKLCPTLTATEQPNIVQEPIAYDEQNQYLRTDGCVGTLSTDGSSPKHNNRVVEPTKQNYRIRKLTPKECWRLMGFADEDVDNAIAVGMSNAQLYKQAGNSIVVNVLMAIFKQML